MRFFELENRPTSAARIGTLLMTGVFLAVVLLAFVAPWIVRGQYAVLGPGDRVNHLQSGLGFVESVEDGEAKVKLDGGRVITVPVSELTEL